MSARHPQPPAVPTRSAVQRLTRGVMGPAARGQPGARARGRAREGGRAPRASRWARPLASVRAPRLLAHVPRAPRSPPRQERAPPALAPGPSRSLRGAHSPELLPRPSPRLRLSTPAARASTPPRRDSVLFSSLRHSPSFSRPSLPPSLPREPGYEAGGLETGVRKMEVPRLDHALNSPTSPCEEVIKNLSLEAIQLCDRDGKSGRDLNERGQARAQAPRPLRLRGPCPPGRQGLLLSPQCK